MATNTSVDADRFAVALTGIVAGVVRPVEANLPEAVRSACKTGAKTARKLARARFGGTGRYASGFRFKVKGGGASTVGEIGNARLPGLVHLLEKGHATLGGGRVAGRPHLSDAADEAEAELWERAVSVVEGALR